MDIEIKPWVKPHLRARLMEEAAAREPKPTEGLTPAVGIAPPYNAQPATSKGCLTGAMTLITGDRVRIKKPAHTLDGPGWDEYGMDKYDGMVVTVLVGTGCDPRHPDDFQIAAGAGDAYDWWMTTNWVTEKL
jgi:hypothetical protein